MVFCGAAGVWMHTMASRLITHIKGCAINPPYKISKSGYLSAWTNVFGAFCFFHVDLKGHRSFELARLCLCSWLPSFERWWITCLGWICSSYLQWVLVPSCSTFLSNSLHIKLIRGPQIHSYEFIMLSRYWTDKSPQKYTNMNFHVQELIIPCTKGEGKKNPHHLEKHEKNKCFSFNDFLENYFWNEKPFLFYYSVSKDDEVSAREELYFSCCQSFFSWQHFKNTALKQKYNICWILHFQQKNE